MEKEIRITLDGQEFPRAGFCGSSTSMNFHDVVEISIGQPFKTATGKQVRNMVIRRQLPLTDIELSLFGV